MTTHGFSDEEWALRTRLVAEMQSGQKTLLQIQQELADYKDPDAAELRRFREREPLVQELVAALGDERPCSHSSDRVTNAWAAVRTFMVKL